MGGEGVVVIAVLDDRWVVDVDAAPTGGVAGDIVWEGPGGIGGGVG